MSDPVNLLAGSIDTLSLETPSDLPAETEAPSPFPFRHLAPELRKEIILESMNPDSPRDDYVELLSVSREFHQVLAPHYWEYLYLDDEGHRIRHLNRLIAIVLPRYGSFVKEANLFRGPISIYGATLRDRIGQVLSAMPNLESLEMSDLLSGVVAASPHLASLRKITLTIEDEDATAVAELVVKCENVTDVSMIVHNVRKGGLLLVAALASRRSLTTLELEIYDTLVEFRSMAGANWRCPLERLHIDNSNTSADFPLPAFRTFISHFSSTLVSLEYHATFASWTQDLEQLYTPFPLPHLVDLTLAPTRLTVKGDTPLVLALFDKSPIETAALFRGVRMHKLGPILDVVVPEFVQAHKGTLKILEVDVPHPDDDGSGGMTADEFIGMIIGAGIELKR